MGSTLQLRTHTKPSMPKHLLKDLAVAVKACHICQYLQGQQCVVPPASSFGPCMNNMQCIHPCIQYSNRALLVQYVPSDQDKKTLAGSNLQTAPLVPAPATLSLPAGSVSPGMELPAPASPWCCLFASISARRPLTVARRLSSCDITLPAPCCC